MLAFILSGLEYVERELMEDFPVASKIPLISAYVLFCWSSLSDEAQCQHLCMNHVSKICI